MGEMECLLLLPQILSSRKTRIKTEYEEVARLELKTAQILSSRKTRIKTPIRLGIPLYL